MYMNNEGTTLATEILQELKASAKRWFAAFVIMLFVEIFTIGGFLWYISLPVDETAVTQDVKDTKDSNVIGIGDYNGESETNSETNTQSNEK